MAYRIIALLIGYCCGLFQTGYIYGRLKDFDLRSHGSGNSGTTNALRTMGIKAGVLVLLGDVLKTVIAVLIVRLVFGGGGFALAGSTDTGTGGKLVDIILLELYAGFGAILGHDFPFYLKFKGGKGMACSAGFLISAMPCVLLPEAVVFLVLVGMTRYVSLGSVAVSALFPVISIAEWKMGLLPVSDDAAPELFCVMVIIAAINVFRHRANIKRLIEGNENKLSFGKKEDS